MAIGQIEEMDIVSDPDVLVRLRSANTVVITPPNEMDSEGVIQIKLFIMTCLHRRTLDPDFQDEMIDWIEGYSPEELQEELQRALMKVQH